MQLAGMTEEIKYLPTREPYSRLPVLTCYPKSHQGDVESRSLLVGLWEVDPIPRTKNGRC